MIKGSPNLLLVGQGRGLGSSLNAICWNLGIFFYVQAENRLSKRWLYGSLAKSLGVIVTCLSEHENSQNSFFIYPYNVKACAYWCTAGYVAFL